MPSSAQSASPSPPARVLIAGCGYVGTALAATLVADGRQVFGLRRHPDTLPAGVVPVAADVTSRDSLAAALSGLPAPPDAVVYAVAASGFSDDAYRQAYVDGPANLLAALDAEGLAPARPARLVFVSSTGVYGDAEGGWVDEKTEPDPAGFSGAHLLAGERLVLGHAGRFTRGAVIVRFGGIYGPGRTRLIDEVRSGAARCTDGPPVWTNRIHRDDCAGSLAHLLDHAAPEPVYLGVDTEPADRCEVLCWIARRLGVPEPPREPASGTGRRRGTKRCSSALLQASGYRFLYPTFREGYAEMIDAAG